MKMRFTMFDGTTFEFNKLASKVTIGRSKKCGVVIPFEGFSREHCELEVANGEVFITDLGSSNGVFINNERIKPKTKTKFKTCLPLSMGLAHSVELDLEEFTPKKDDFSQKNIQREKTNTTSNVLKFRKKDGELTDEKVTPKKSFSLLNTLKSIFFFGMLITGYLGYNFIKENFFSEKNETEELEKLEFEMKTKSKKNDGSIKTKDF